MEPGTRRISVVHDYLTQRGGAERVVLSLLRSLEKESVHTIVYDSDNTWPGFKELRVQTSYMQRIPLARRDPRLFLPSLPFAVRRFCFPDEELVLCSTSGWAHGVVARNKVAYCYTPARWLYEPEDYFANSMVLRRAVAPLLSGLRRWDQRMAQEVRTFVTLSSMTAQRIERVYHRESIIVPPPVTVHTQGREEALAIGYRAFALAVARPRGYKNVEFLIAAMSLLPNMSLIIVGSAPTAAKGVPNVLALGSVSDEQLRWLYKRCSVVVSAAREDFGLTPLEGNAYGKPCAVLKHGGFLDTVAEGITGVFFSDTTPAAIASAINEACRGEWDEARIMAHAEGYGEAAFATRLRASLAGT